MYAYCLFRDIRQFILVALSVYNKAHSLYNVVLMCKNNIVQVNDPASLSFRIENKAIIHGIIEFHNSNGIGECRYTSLIPRAYV